MNGISVEEMNRILYEKVPLEDRLRSVYVPLTLMLCIGRMIDGLTTLMRLMRRDEPKEFYRGIKSVMESMEKEYIQTMNERLYSFIKRYADNFFLAFMDDFVVYQLSYINLLKENYDEDFRSIGARAYILKVFTKYVIQYDRDSTKMIQKYIGNAFHYVTQDDKNCTRILELVDTFFSKFGMDPNLASNNTEMSYNVFRNRVKNIKYKWEDMDNG